MSFAINNPCARLPCGSGARNIAFCLSSHGVYRLTRRTTRRFERATRFPFNCTSQRENTTVSDEVVEVSGSDDLENGAVPDVSASSNGSDVLMPPGVNEETIKRVARYSAKKAASKFVEEGSRPLGEYMALPVSQYSVLDAARIERIDENNFKCYIGAFSMFGMKVIPILTVSVETHSKGCIIKLLDCELDGSDAVRAVNGNYASRMTNMVSWDEQEDGRKLISSDCTIEVAGIIPRYFTFVPVRVVEAVGNAVMRQVVNISVPRFLKQLEKDYLNWAQGDDSRAAVGTGEWGELNVDGNSDTSPDA